MQKYTLSLLLSATLSDEQLAGVLEQIKKLITKFNGRIVETKKTDRKRLAFVIKKIRNGIYGDVIFEIDKDKMVNLDKELKLLPEVIRFIIMKYTDRGGKKKLDEKIKPKPKKEIKIEDLDKKIDELLDDEII